MNNADEILRSIQVISPLKVFDCLIRGSGSKAVSHTHMEVVDSIQTQLEILDDEVLEHLDDFEDFLDTVDEGQGGKAEVGGTDGLADLGGTGGAGNGL